MDQNFKSTKNEIERLLNKTKEIINDPCFDYKNQFILYERKNDFEANVYNNKSTMMLLSFDTIDLVREISQLEYKDYYETIVDVIGSEIFLYVFKKEIKGYLIYIKFSIRNNKIIFCISFHVSKENKKGKV